MQLFSSRGIIITNQTLVLQGIAKATHGHYVCRATNPQGTIGSNRVYVDVKCKRTAAGTDRFAPSPH